MSGPPELDLELIRLRAEQDSLTSPPEAPRSDSPPPPDEVIVRADEVDHVDEGKLQRPILRREGSAPPPPPRQPPPPAPPNQQDGQSWSDGPAGNSLSLAQLRDIVSRLPGREPKAYAYSYSETRTLAEEIEEWFQYTEEDKNFLALAKEHFSDAITDFNATKGQQDLVELKASWPEFSVEDKEDFVSLLLKIADMDDVEAGKHASLALFYLATGAWVKLPDEPIEPRENEVQSFMPPNDKYKRFIPQIRAIKDAAHILCSGGAVPFMFERLRDILSKSLQVSELSGETSSSLAYRIAEQLQLSACLSVLYLMALVAGELGTKDDNEVIRKVFLELEPDILQYLTQTLARLRWEETSHIPFTRVLLLLWKLILVILGHEKDRENVKQVIKSPEDCDKEKGESFLTASPLDYHAFRQEITSKYPAYNPPPPLVPLEINNNTMLPLATPSLSSHASMDDLSGSQGASKSIFYQPTHIATPAPSPPPTPGGPGKGGKKQNYQTNQNFPFMYPPLDSTSNDLGGKGGAHMQDQLVGKRWDGSDVPTSILEAAQLFHSRMRMSRAMRQLWNVREQFLKYDRGWIDDNQEVNKDDEDSLDEFELDEEDEEEQTRSTDKKDNRNTAGASIKNPETDDPEVQARLNEIEKYYKASFRDLQSVVIVLLKVLLSNITVLGTASTVNPPATQIMDGVDILPKENLNLSLCLSGNNHIPVPNPGSIEALNAIRTREITSKAITGLLLSLLKWFRISHILKFEYFTQLLLDSNYVPLSLKYFALQDVDKAVDLKQDRDDLSFFRLCQLLSSGDSLPMSTTSPHRSLSPDSLDDAVPPPIARARPPSPSSNSSSSPPPSPGSPPSPPRKPEVDELGCPTTTIPTTPLTTYAPRFFQTHINLLRILQKLTKSHAHRSLLLVQYKSSIILRKGLKIPQPELRLYTLKLFKSQVPYCGRKWRQNNMRVITAIYVFCRMGLRDEWISGSQGMVDEWVEGARDIERAWRGLCGWWHRRVYKEILSESKNGEAVHEEENDFFTRELAKMGWSVGGLIDDAGNYDEVDDGEGLMENGVNLDGVPLMPPNNGVINGAQDSRAEQAALRQMQSDA